MLAGGQATICIQPKLCKTVSWLNTNPSKGSYTPLNKNLYCILNILHGDSQPINAGQQT